MKSTRLLQILTIFAGSAALMAQTGFAQPSSGLSITNDVVGATNAVWDFTQLTNQLGALRFSIPEAARHPGADFSYADEYTQNGQGKLAGGPETTSVDLTLHGTAGGGTFEGTNTARGLVSGAMGVAHLVFASRVTGMAEVSGALRHVTGSVAYTVKFDGPHDLVIGHGVEIASASGLGSISGTSIISNSLPADIGSGAWTLVLNFTNAPSVTKLGGDASVTLETGAEYPFTFTGVFAPHGGADMLGQSLLNLKGVNAGAGCALAVTLNSGNHITRVVGRISGQSVSIKQ